MLNRVFFACSFLLLSIATVRSAPTSISSQVETLRISGVSERDIEHALNPNHALASAHESTVAASLASSQLFLLSALASSTDPEFAATIDGYSTAKPSPDSPTPASASLGNLAFEEPIEEVSSLGAFERVRRWMSRRASDGEDRLIVTGRMGALKVRGRR